MRGYIQPHKDDLTEFLATAKRLVPTMIIEQSEDEPTVYIMQSHYPMDFWRMGAIYGGILAKRIEEQQT